MFEPSAPSTAVAHSAKPPAPTAWAGRLPHDLEHEFKEMQAAAAMPSPTLGLLLTGALYQAMLIGEQVALHLPSRIYLVRGLPLAALVIALLFLPTRLRQQDSGCAALSVFLPIMVLALATGIPFATPSELFMVETGISVLIASAGMLLYLPWVWTMAMVLGALAANVDSLLAGPGLHLLGMAMLLQSLWAPVFATISVVLVAWVRHNEARRNFLVLRQAVFSNAPGKTAETRHLDAQTGVSTRVAFDMRFRAAWEHAASRRQSVALLLFSIDQFADRRREFGSQVAELMQGHVASCLQESLRRSDDMVARFDNQHFVVMLPGVGTDGATQIAERLRVMIEEMSIFAGQKRHQVTVTVGAASLRAKRSIAREKLIDGAIQALDQARATGYNLVCVEGRGCIPAMS